MSASTAVHGMFSVHSRSRSRRPRDLTGGRDLVREPAVAPALPDRRHPTRDVLQRRQQAGELRTQLHVRAQGRHPHERRRRGRPGRRR